MAGRFRGSRLKDGRFASVNNNIGFSWDLKYALFLGVSSKFAKNFFGVC